jgi:ABC-2 type transport system permease protein
MWRRLHQMLIKEFIQVFRDPRTHFLLFGPPIIQMVVFGYAATLEIQHVPMAIVDYENSQVSRDFVSRFTGSRYFDVRERTLDRDKVKTMIDHGDLVLAVQINAGFSERLRKGQTAQVQAIVDASNSNTALVSLGYVNLVASRFAQDYQAEMANRTSPQMLQQIPSISLERQPWFNPDLRSQWFFVPGVMGNLMTVIIVLLTAFAVVREREIGTLEQIMVTPIRPIEFILGKTLPFFLIGLGEVALVMAVGLLWFRVPFNGNPLVMLLGTSFFLLSTLALGLLISTICTTQQQAFATNFFVVNPLFTLSGFSFPIASMPRVLQWFSYVNPLRYYLVLIRACFLKGVGFSVLWPDLLALAGLGTLLLTASILRFRKSLD